LWIRAAQLRFGRFGTSTPELTASAGIDGNFGGAAGIVEALLQSHEGFIALLPVLPALMVTAITKSLLDGRCGCRLSRSPLFRTRSNFDLKALARAPNDPYGV